jgi:hypothetical protein
MSHFVICSNRNPRVLLGLANELRKMMPNLKLNGMDRTILLYAFQDLQVCLTIRLDAKNIHQLKTKLWNFLEENSDEFKAFLKVWVGQWVKHWRNRITFSFEKRKISTSYFKNLRKAYKVYRMMKEKSKLIELVTRRLINKGEVCRPNQIAENLIVKEIADQLSRCPKRNLKFISLNLIEIVHGVYSRIDKLIKNKKPILHMIIFSKRKQI